MKKSIKTVISFVLITLLALSFSSCSVFQSMRENALNAAQTTIYATPEKEQIIFEYNTLLAASLMSATEIKENVSYSAGKPDVLKESEEAGVLDAAANQLKTFIMSAKPGSASAVLEEGADSLLKSLDEAAVLNFDFTRNIATENVTDEKGNEVHDENDIAVTHRLFKLFREMSLYLLDHIIVTGTHCISLKNRNLLFPADTKFSEAIGEYK